MGESEKARPTGEIRIRHGAQEIEWATEWDRTGNQCKHGRFVPYRWILWMPEGERPTDDDFGDSEPEIGKNGCKKCAAEAETERIAELRELGLL